MSSTVQVHSMPGSPNDVCQQCHGWGYKPPLSATPHLHYAYSKVCLSTSLWYAVDMHLGTPFGWDTCAGGGEFLDNWDKAPVARGTSDDMVSWLRLQPPPPNCILHPTFILYVYGTNCLNTLICRGWQAYGCTLTCNPAEQVGVQFRKIGNLLWLMIPNGVAAVFMVDATKLPCWLQSHIHIGPHPYWMYRNCLRLCTLIRCERAYG